jgi:hypothetical protein
MHFHSPKPLHGWREFAGEVGIIVIGVLIALGAEQAVEKVHWRLEVRETDQRVQKDVVANLTNAEERFAIDPCLRPRLTELRDALLVERSMWPGSQLHFANDVYKSEFPSVYRTPVRPWIETSWHSAQNGETLSHFDPDRVQQLAALFDDADALRVTQAEEEKASEDLGDLAFPGLITAAERRSHLNTVAKLDTLDSRILYLAQLFLTDAREAGIAPDPESVRKAILQQKAYRGACVKSRL